MGKKYSKYTKLTKKAHNLTWYNLPNWSRLCIAGSLPMGMLAAGFYI
jgi:hypothetical protein